MVPGRWLCPELFKTILTKMQFLFRFTYHRLWHALILGHNSYLIYSWYPNAICITKLLSIIIIYSICNISTLWKLSLDYWHQYWTLQFKAIHICMSTTCVYIQWGYQLGGHITNSSKCLSLFGSTDVYKYSMCWEPHMQYLTFMASF